MGKVEGGTWAQHGITSSTQQENDPVTPLPNFLSMKKELSYL